MTIQNIIRFCARTGFVALAIGLSTAALAEWKPDKSIELIVGTGPGSGVDNTARTAQSVLQTQKLVDLQITVNNKAGSAFAIAYNYLSQFPGDGATPAARSGNG